MANSTEEFFAKKPVLHGTVMIVLVTTGKVNRHHYDIPKTQRIIASRNWKSLRHPIDGINKKYTK
jgi:hypothetical protein